MERSTSSGLDERVYHYCDITILQESSGGLHLSRLAKFDIYWIEEPTSADDILGHKYIAEQLKPYGNLQTKSIRPQFF